MNRIGSARFMTTPGPGYHRTPDPRGVQNGSCLGNPRLLHILSEVVETNLPDAAFWTERSWESPSSVARLPFCSLRRELLESARRVWRSGRFLPSTSRPRCHHCAGPEPAFVRCVLVSNRISIRMAAALSLQLQLSSLKLIRPSSLFTTPLSLSRCCPSLLSPSSRSLPSLSSSVWMRPSSVSPHLLRSPRF